ncbi:hypothetical protein ACFL2H_01860 [Planctomycetota bacterium]
MANCRLRIYNGPDDCGEPTSELESAKSQTVTVPLGEVISSLADAVESNRMWLRDFEDDEVTISADLYEVMLAYRALCRSSA